MATTKKQNGMNETSKELFTLWVESKTDKKKQWNLSNFIKEEIIIPAGQGKKEVTMECSNITSLIIIDTISFIIKSQLGVETVLNLKERKAVFKNLAEVEKNLTPSQKRYYNTNKETDFKFTREELEKEKAEKNLDKNEKFMEVSEQYGIEIAELL